MTKVISISDETYTTLKRIKGKRSFSETILAAVKPRKTTIMDVFGKWPGPKEELDRIELRLAKERKEAKMRDATF